MFLKGLGVKDMSLVMILFLVILVGWLVGKCLVDGWVGGIWLLGDCSVVGWLVSSCLVGKWLVAWLVGLWAGGWLVLTKKN